MKIETTTDSEGKIISSHIVDKTLVGWWATKYKYLAEWDGEKYVVPGNNNQILKRIFKEVKALKLQRKGMYYYRLQDIESPVKYKDVICVWP